MMKKILSDIIPRTNNDDQNNVFPVDSRESRQSVDNTLLRYEATDYEKGTIDKIGKINTNIRDNPFFLRYAKHSVDDSMADRMTPELQKEEEIAATSRPPVPPQREDYSAYNTHERNGGAKWRWVLAFVSVAVLVLAVIYTTSKSEALVIPKQSTSTVRDISVSLSNSDIEVFKKVETDISEEEEVLSDGSTTESQRATGRVILYNAYSTAKQNLLIDTRLETDGGLVFKTKVPVSIPGYTTKDGTVVPGQVEVDVYADQPGEAYNIGLSDFKFVGFKTNAAKYEKFYARSVTPMNGGSEGLVYTLSEQKRDEAVSLMITSVSDRVYTKMQNDVEEGYVAITSSYLAESPVLETSTRSSDINLKQKVSVHASMYVVHEDTLISKILEASGGANDIKYNITDLAALKIETTNITGSTIDLAISGDLSLVGDVDTEILKRELLGKNVQNIQSIIVPFPEIDKISFKLKPFWRKNLPEDIERLNITIVTNE